jgi:hypothetical protein
VPPPASLWHVEHLRERLDVSPLLIKLRASRRLSFSSSRRRRRVPDLASIAPPPSAIHCNWLCSKLHNLLAHRLIPLAPCLSIGNARRAVSSSRPAATPPWSGRCGQATSVSLSPCGIVFKLRHVLLILPALLIWSLPALLAGATCAATIGPPWPV